MNEPCTFVICAAARKVLLSWCGTRRGRGSAVEPCTCINVTESCTHVNESCTYVVCVAVRKVVHSEKE